MKNAKYETRPTPTDSELTPFSHSILSAANTCPIYGVVRYGLRKKYESDARAMALEFGAAAHEVFAAIYLWQIGHIQGLRDHMLHHGRRIFNGDRFENALRTVDKDPEDRDKLISLGYEILRTGEFYDDPNDYIRTTHNLELGIIKYVDNVLGSMPDWPIWIADESDPTKAIGVEVAFDIELVRRLDLSKKSGKETPHTSYGYTRNLRPIEQVVRYIGQIDRLHDIRRGDSDRLVLGENKTGSRLDSSWSLSFDMSHQITSYLLAAYTLTGRECVESRVHGLKNKQTGHSDDFNPISPMHRTTEMFENFIDWAIDSASVYERYVGNYEDAPRYTHSCNRYFRPCALIPFCCDTREGRAMQLESDMVDGDLSPSEQAVMDRLGMLET